MVKASFGKEQKRQMLTYAAQNVVRIEWRGKGIKRFVAVLVGWFFILLLLILVQVLISTDTRCDLFF
jgi:hypothetical protein